MYFQDTQNETQFPEKADSSEKPCIDLANYRAFFRYASISTIEFIFQINLECEVVMFIREGYDHVDLFSFRELDISVFTILHTGLITRSSLDTELNTKVTIHRLCIVHYISILSDITSW